MIKKIETYLNRRIRKYELAKSVLNDEEMILWKGKRRLKFVNKVNLFKRKDDYIYFSIGRDVVIFRYLGSEKNIIIPRKIRGRKVRFLFEWSFRDLGLESVEIPDTVQVIGELAFGSNNIKEVRIPESVKHIGEDAFYNNEIGFLEISGKHTRISQDAFSHNEIEKLM